jgi:hypothetical protein
MASGRTTVHHRPYPLETDAPDVAADIEALANSLEGAPNVGVGTLASLPETIWPSGAPLVAGDRYLVEGDSTAYNNGSEWIYTGSTWLLLATAPGPWTNLTPGTGVAVPSVAISRTEHDVVRCQGLLLNDSGSAIAYPTIIATGLVLPPLATTSRVVASGTSSLVVSITTSGDIQAGSSWPTGTEIDLGGIVFAASSS